MKTLVCLCLIGTSAFAAQGLRFSVSDGRGKETSSVTLEGGTTAEDGWQPVRIAKAKGDATLIWPFDALAKAPDGPSPIPAIVIQKGEEKSLATKSVAAALAVPVVLGISSTDDAAARLALSARALTMAFDDLKSSADAFQKGVGLLYEGKNTDAIEPLATALRQRQRQLTRVPSDIYPAALLYGLALHRAGKFDDAAVAFLTAQKQRPSSELARRLRNEALVKAGKGEAVGR